MASNPASSGNRWGIAIAGIVVMLCLGTVYSWSIFTHPLIAGVRLVNARRTWAFEVAIFFFGIGAVIGGRWQDRVGPRTVTIVGVILWGAACCLPGSARSMGKWWLYSLTVSSVASATAWLTSRRLPWSRSGSPIGAESAAAWS